CTMWHLQLVEETDHRHQCSEVLEVGVCAGSIVGVVGRTLSMLVRHHIHPVWVSLVREVELTISVATPTAQHTQQVAEWLALCGDGSVGQQVEVLHRHAERALCFSG